MRLLHVRAIFVAGKTSSGHVSGCDEFLSVSASPVSASQMVSRLLACHFGAQRGWNPRRMRNDSRPTTAAFWDVTRMRQSKLRCLLCSISKRYHVCRARSKCIGVPHDHFSLTPRPRLYIDEYLSSRCAGRCAVLTTSFTVSTTATIRYSTYTPATLLFLH